MEKSGSSNFKVKQLPHDYNQEKMENEAREHLNLAQYNFNRMAVIDEEGAEGHGAQGNAQGEQAGATELTSAGKDRRVSGKNQMHNTTSGFYPPRFGDRVPTRGDMQSRGRTNLIPSAQGARRGNSRAENSLGRVQ